MNAGALYESIRAMWPTFQVGSEAFVSAWGHVVSGMSVEVAMKALRAHAEDGRWAPTISEFLVALRKTGGAAAVRRERSEEYECVGKRDGCAWRGLGYGAAARHMDGCAQAQAVIGRGRSVASAVCREWIEKHGGAADSAAGRTT